MSWKRYSSIWWIFFLPARSGQLLLSQLSSRGSYSQHQQGDTTEKNKFKTSTFSLKLSSDQCGTSLLWFTFSSSTMTLATLKVSLLSKCQRLINATAHHVLNSHYNTLVPCLCFLHISKEVYLMSLICQFCNTIQPPLKKYIISSTGDFLKQILL